MFARRFKWLSALPVLAVILALAVISIRTLSGAHSPNATSREVLFDYFQRLKPADAVNASPFHLVEIDQESLELVGPWPWPRSILADLVDQTQSAGAKAVLVTIPVDAPDPLSPTVISDFWLTSASDEELATQLSLLPSTDAALAKALASTNASAAISGAFSGIAPSLDRADTKLVPWLSITGGDSDFLAMPSASLQFPVNELISEAAQMAVAALPSDPDGIVRRAPLFWSVDGVPTPSIAVEAARLALDDQLITLSADANAVSSAGQSIKAITIGAEKLPLSSASTLRIYNTKRPEIAKTSASKLLGGATSNSQVRGKVVLIGLDKNIGSMRKLSRGEFSLTEAHGLVAAQLHDGIAVKRPGWIGYGEAILVMLLGAAAIMWSQSLDFWKALGVAAIASAILFIGSFSTFFFSTFSFNPLPASLALFLGAFSVAGGRSLGVVLRDDTVRGSFQGSLPEAAMKKIREEGATGLLEGTRRPVTVLACELRLLDEDLQRLSQHPDDVTNMLATACNSLRNTIIETGGAADQSDGGKIFAYFNAPLEAADHVDAACSAALRLVESMDKTNAELEASNRTRGVQLHLAIGIATGSCFIGPMGHGRSNRYSAIGPAVDMAAFLRKQAEFYGPAIICDESVYRDTHHHFAYLELDRLRTNKSTSPSSIFALVGNPFIKSSKSYRALDEAHRDLLTAYRSGDWETARKQLGKVKQSPGAAIALFDIYEERLAKMAGQDLPSDWDGAHSVII